MPVGGPSGDEDASCDRRTSAAHAAIPLHSTEAVHRLPMIQRLIQQLGLDVDEVVKSHPDLFVDLDQRTYDVFPRGQRGWQATMSLPRTISSSGTA